MRLVCADQVAIRCLARVFVCVQSGGSGSDEVPQLTTFMPADGLRWKNFLSTCPSRLCGLPAAASFHTPGTMHFAGLRCRLDEISFALEHCESVVGLLNPVSATTSTITY